MSSFLPAGIYFRRFTSVIEFPNVCCSGYVSQVGFPTDNDRYIYVLEAAGEALTQVIQNVNVPNETPLAENEELDNWIECYRCGKSRKVSQEYYDQNEASQTWHCSIEGSPVPLPEEGRYEFSCGVAGDMHLWRT